MIPRPRGPGDVIPGPEEPIPRQRGGEPTSLVFQAMEEIDGLKKSLEALVQRVDALEHRLGSLEPSTA